MKVTPGCASADTTGKIELRLGIWKRKRVKQIYFFVEESDPQQSRPSQGTTAPAGLRNFPVHSGHGSRSGRASSFWLLAPTSVTGPVLS